MNIIGRVLIGAVTALALAWPSAAEEPLSDDPPECHWPAEKADRWAACAVAAREGSGLWVLAHMNLASDAFLERDFETAAHHYDLTTQTELQGIMSDPFFHAFRSSTFFYVGRRDEALVDAKTVLSFIERDLSGVQPDAPPLDDADLVTLYAAILEVLVAADAPEAEQALEAFRALPADSVYDVMNRAAVFTELGLYDEAMPFSDVALELSNNHPAALNNHCYLLTLMGRADEAIGYCEQAIATEPDEPTLLHSYAAALAAAGRCDEADANLTRAAELNPSAVAYQEPLACDPTVP